MDQLECPECGGTLLTVAREDRILCPRCGIVWSAGPLRGRRAVERLRQHLERAAHLPEELRVDLLSRLARERVEVERLSAEPPAAEHDLPAPEVPPPIPRLRPAPPPPKPKGPSVWTKLGPLFAENLLFALAAFLLVAGAVYFVTTAWTTMSGAERRLVVVGGLGLLGGLLYAASRLVNRDGALPGAERLLLFVIGALAPIAAAPAGELLLDRPSLGLAAAAFVLAAGFLALRALGRREDPALGRALPAGGTAMLVLVLAAPLAPAAPMSAAATFGVALLALAGVAGRRVAPAVPRAAPLLRSFLLLAFAALAAGTVAALAAAREGLGAAAALAIPGVVAAGAGAALVRLEIDRSRAGGGGSLPLLAAGLAVAVAGTAIATGNERGLLAAALLGTFAGIGAGLRIPGGLALVPGLALAAVAWLHLPAPFREMATKVRDAAAEGLGYAPKRLPWSFYGVTFVPYVAAVGVFGTWLGRRDRPAHARVALGFALFAAASLAALAIFGGTDLRAPAAVLSAQGALLLVLAFASRAPAFAGLGTAGLVAGLACALGVLAPPPGIRILAMSGAAMLGLAAVRRFAPKPAGPAREIVDVLGAAAAAGVLVALFSLRPEIASAASDVPGYLALALLVAVLGEVWGRPDVLAAAALPLLKAVAGVLAATGTGTAGWPAGLAGAAAAVFALAFAAPRLARYFPSRPLSLTPGRNVLPATVAGLAALSLPFLAALTDRGAWGPLPAAGVLALAALTFAAGRAARQAWAQGVAAALLPVAGVAVALAFAAVGADPVRMPRALGAAIGLAAAAAFVSWLGRRGDEARGEAAAAAAPLPFLGGLLLCWIVFRLPEAAYRASSTEGLFLAGAALVVAAALRLSLDRFRGPLGAFAAVVAGAAVAFVPVGLLDALEPRLELYPLGLLLAAAATAVMGLDRPALARTAVGHLAAALVLALVGGITEGTDGRLLLLAFAGIVEGSRVAAKHLPRLGGLLLLLAIGGGASFALGERVLGLDPRWQGPLWLLLAAGALVAPRWPALRIHPLPARIVSIPVLAVATLFLVGLAAFVAIEEGSTSDFADADLAALAVSAVVYAAGASVLLSGRRTRFRVAANAVAIALAATAFPVVNVLLHGWTRFWRPDVEFALGAVFLATRHPRVDRPPLALLLLLAGAVLLTGGEVDDLSTPLAVLAAAAVPLVLFLRGEAAGTLGWSAAGFLVSALAFATWAVPKTGRPVPEIFPLWAAIAALLAPAYRLAADRVATFARGRESLRAAAGWSVGLAVLLVAANAVLLRGTPAGDAGIALAVLAGGVAVAGGLASFRSGGGVLEWRGTGAAMTAVYLFLALRTGALDLLDGFHLHALAGAGLALLLLRDRLPERVRGAASTDALLAPLPAALAALLDPAPGAFLLAATVWGTGAVRLSRPPLAVAAAAGLNFALFSIWRRSGIVDPAFYGVPPGLTLLVAAEAFRARLSDAARLGLLVAGAALLYGSVAVQVLRVEEPTHALVLFGMGLATVLAGFLRRRHGALVLGAVVVVLDVVAYLARHGFEQSFLAAGLLVLAGLTVLAVGVASSRSDRK